MKATANNTTTRNPVWLFAAPFVGLAYVLAAPVVGLVALAWVAAKAFAARWPKAARVVKDVALFFAAPFVGLAYALAFPFVGVTVLAWRAVRAAHRRLATAN